MELTEQTGTPAEVEGSIATTTESGTSSDSRTFVQILPDQLPFVQGFAWTCFFQMASVTHGELAPEDYWTRIEKGLMQFFVLSEKGIPRLGVVTEFVQYPRFKMLRIVGIAGKDPIKARRFWKGFCDWAVLNGAVGVDTFATPETVKLVERLGLKPYVTLMRHFI